VGDAINASGRNQMHIAYDAFGGANLTHTEYGGAHFDE